MRATHPAARALGALRKLLATGKTTAAHCQRRLHRRSFQGPAAAPRSSDAISVLSWDDGAPEHLDVVRRRRSASTSSSTPSTSWRTANSSWSHPTNRSRAASSATSIGHDSTLSWDRDSPEQLDLAEERRLKDLRTERVRPRKMIIDRAMMTGSDVQDAQDPELLPLAPAWEVGDGRGANIVVGARMPACLRNAIVWQCERNALAARVG